MIGAVGVALATIDPAPFGVLIQTGTPAPGTFIFALVIAVGTSFLAHAGYLWAMRGVALELPG